jgi:hypothetical protein
MGEAVSVESAGHDDMRWDELSTPPGAPDAHPNDVDLAAGVPEALKHAVDCAYCTQRLSGAAAPEHWSPALDDDEAFDEAVRRHLAGPAGAELENVTMLPASVHALMTDADADLDVAAGQIWRLRRGPHRMLVAVVRVQGWLVEVAPVSTDVAHADVYAWRLPVPATDLGVPLVVFMAAEQTVPLLTFDTLVADLNDTVGAQVVPLLRGLQRATRTAGDPPDGLSVGPRTSEADIDRRELRSALQEQMAPFVAAVHDLPEGGREGELADLVAARSHDDPAFAANGIDAGTYLDLVQRHRATREVAERLAAVLNMSIGQVLALNPPLPSAAIVEVSRPRVRHYFEEAAESEAEALRDRWDVAAQVVAQAARSVPTSQRGGDVGGDFDGGDPGYAAKLRRILEDRRLHRHGLLGPQVPPD